VQGVNKWVDLAAWKAGSRLPFDTSSDWNRDGREIQRKLEEYLEGRSCCGGLDLSSNIDISAFVLVFPPVVPDEPWWLLPRFWIPEESIMERVRNDRVPYNVWVNQGLVTATPGNVIDYDWILDQIGRDAERFDIGDIAFDRWGSVQIANRLMEMGGDEWMVQFGQGFASMSAPMKELEKLIKSQLLGHGGHPVLTWMADNLVARVDPAGNIKPDKAQSREKIDGLVAGIMGLDRAQRHQPKGPSVYEERGIREL